LNYLDYIILLFVLVGFLLGFKDGLVRKIIGLLGLIAGVALAFEFSGKLGKLLTPFFNNDSYLAGLIGGILIFLVTIFLASVIKRIVHPLDKVNKFINQLLGGLIGVVQLVYFTSTIFLFLNIFAFPKNADRTNSMFYNPVLNLIPKTIELVMGERSRATDYLREYIEKKDVDSTSQIKSIIK
jgi:membrane protein required for colicin V production